MERKLSEMEEELKVRSLIWYAFLIMNLFVVYVKANGRKCFHTLNRAMRRLDTIVCDFYMYEYTYQYIYDFRFCLVSYTPSSLFSCVAVNASGKSKDSNDYFWYEDPIRFGYIRFSLPGNFTQIGALLSFLISTFFLIVTRFLYFFFFSREAVSFSSPFLYFPRVPLLWELRSVAWGAGNCTRFLTGLLMERELVICFFGYFGN